MFTCFSHMRNREPRQARHPADLRACVLAVRGCRDPAAAHQSTLLPERPSRRSSTPAREPPVSDADRAACPPPYRQCSANFPHSTVQRQTALCTGSYILALSRDSRGGRWGAPIDQQGAVRRVAARSAAFPGAARHCEATVQPPFVPFISVS